MFRISWMNKRLLCVEIPKARVYFQIRGWQFLFMAGLNPAPKGSLNRMLLECEGTAPSGPPWGLAASLVIICQCQHQIRERNKRGQAKGRLFRELCQAGEMRQPVPRASWRSGLGQVIEEGVGSGRDDTLSPGTGVS